MSQCDEHKDSMKKIVETCVKVENHATRLTQVETDVCAIKEELWTNPDSLRSRIKGQEDQSHHLQELILENRKMVVEQLKDFKEDMGEAIMMVAKNGDDKLKGFFKIFILTISAASFIVVGMFGLLWKEVKEVQMTTPAVYNQEVPSHVQKADSAEQGGKS